jgi:hypothetical protein
MPTLISFYTNDWKYPAHAELLTQDCIRLGIDHYIIERPNSNSYVNNCNMKPFFILECLEKFKHPVIWYDVDGSINRLPEEIVNNTVLNYDIAGHKNVRLSDKIYVNSLWFNYTPTVLEFVNEWCQRTVNFIDDGAFNASLKIFKDKIKLLVLDKSSHLMINTNARSLPPESYFVHRLSGSDLKWQYKRKVEKQ